MPAMLNSPFILVGLSRHQELQYSMDPSIERSSELRHGGDMLEHKDTMIILT